MLNVLRPLALLLLICLTDTSAALTPALFVQPREGIAIGTWGSPPDSCGGYTDYGIWYTSPQIGQPQPYRACSNGYLSAELLCSQGIPIASRYDYIAGGNRADLCGLGVTACEAPYGLSSDPENYARYGFSPTRVYGQSYVCVTSAANACGQIANAQWTGSICVCKLGYTEQSNHCVNAKTLGVSTACTQSAPSPHVGNPIHAGTGNKYQAESDYTEPGAFPLQLTRHYNSQATGAGEFGAGWSAFARLTFLDASHLTAHRPDGQVLAYTLANGAWSADADVTERLAALGSGYRLTTAEGATETYSASGQLLTLADPTGLTQAYSYDPTGQLTAITDSFGRSLTFTHDAMGRIATLTDPAGGVYTYAYDPAGNLSSVTHPDATPRTYHYEDPRFPHALTGISDETGQRFATWAYDPQGRAVLSEHANGAERVSLSYNADGSTSVTDALGTARNYGFTTVQGVVKSSGVSQPGGAGCSAANSAVSYDAHGNVASRADFNGHTTTYAHDLARNLETTRSEAVATPEQRTVETDWHPRLALPTELRERDANGTLLRTTRLTYDGDNQAPSPKGDLTRREILDPATGATRTWTWTYTYHPTTPGALLQQIEDGPRTDVSDVTTTDYYPPDAACAGAAPGQDKGCRGQVRQITNALGHVTQVTRYTAHGQPEVILDPNGVTTTLAYDARQRLVSHTLDGHTTTYQYDPAGQLIQITLPDGGTTSYTHDAAHRLTGITDALGNQVSYTLDGLGNRLAETWHNPDGSVAQTRSQSFDALGRIWQEVGAANQTTTHAHDPQGNPTASTDPKNQTTTYGHDALDRLTRITDALNGLTQIGYDPLDQVTAVTAPNGAATTYQYDGMGNRVSETSADSGTTSYTHDAAGNVLTRTNARGLATAYTYDALDRLTGIDIPAVGTQPSRTLRYTWDSAPGCTHGIGKLCQVVHALGTTTYAYDARGNLVQETREKDGVSYTTHFAPDAADRVQDTVTPTGETVNRQRDNTGRITQVAATSAAGTTVVSQGLAYNATGQLTTQTLGEGLTTTQSYDPDGRPTFQTLSAGTSGQSAADTDVPTLPEWGLLLLGAGLLGSLIQRGKGRAARLGLMMLGLACFLAGVLNTGTAWAGDVTLQYDANGNVASKTTAAGTTTFTYDPLDRIDTEAGPAATRDHDFDANGNRLTDGAGISSGHPPTANASYAPNSDRLATLNGIPVTLDAAGNLTSDGTNRYVWDGAEQLAEVRKPDTTLLASYLYDHRGLRGRKVTTAAAPQGAGTTDYHYDQQGHLIAETTGTGSPLLTYVWRDDTLTGVITHQPSRTVYTVRTDHLGSPYEVLTLSGKVVWRWESEAFGATAPNEDPDGDGQKFTLNLRFPGQYFDQESGLFYNGHRYYDPRIGRYLSVDPIGLAGGLNGFAYANNAPTMYTDPSGLAAAIPAGPVPIPLPPVFIPGTPENKSFTDSTIRGIKGLGDLVRSAMKATSAMDECEQECDDALDRDYAYCKALGGMYNDYRTRKACEERAFAKYVQCRKQCKEKCR